MKTQIERARRNVSISIYGYGGDAVVWFCAIAIGIISGVRGLVDLDYSRSILKHHSDGQ